MLGRALRTLSSVTDSEVACLKRLLAIVSTRLAELRLIGACTVSPGESLSLGLFWQTERHYNVTHYNVTYFTDSITDLNDRTKWKTRIYAACRSEHLVSRLQGYSHAEEGRERPQSEAVQLSAHVGHLVLLRLGNIVQFLGGHKAFHPPAPRMQSFGKAAMRCWR